MNAVETILCPECHGNGYGPEAQDPQDTKFCACCKGDGEVSREMFERYMDAAAAFESYDDGRGDYLYEQWKDRQANK